MPIVIIESIKLVQKNNKSRKGWYREFKGIGNDETKRTALLKQNENVTVEDEQKHILELWSLPKNSKELKKQAYFYNTYEVPQYETRNRLRYQKLADERAEELKRIGITKESQRRELAQIKLIDKIRQTSGDLTKESVNTLKDRYSKAESRIIKALSDHVNTPLDDMTEEQFRNSLNSYMSSNSGYHKENMTLFLDDVTAKWCNDNQTRLNKK